MSVKTDGSLSVKRSSRVLSTASYVVELNEKNIVKYGTLKYCMNELMNIASVNWNWDDIQKKYTRITAVVDPVSSAADKHGKATVRFHSFRGI